MYCIYELQGKTSTKEGATVADIAAGLCYSVIKNAIQKVIKVRDPKNSVKTLLFKVEHFMVMLF